MGNSSTPDGERNDWQGEELDVVEGWKAGDAIRLVVIDILSGGSETGRVEGTLMSQRIERGKQVTLVQGPEESSRVTRTVPQSIRRLRDGTIILIGTRNAYRLEKKEEKKGDE